MYVETLCHAPGINQLNCYTMETLSYCHALNKRAPANPRSQQQIFSSPKAPRAKRNSRLSPRTGKIQAQPPRWPKPPRGGACRSGFAIRRGKPGFRGRFLAARPLNGRRLELPIQMARGQARTPMLSYCAGAASACRGNGPPLETALAAVRNRLV
jgi:hypothetical protein